MRVNSCEVGLIALSTPALLWMSPAPARSPEDTVFIDSHIARRQYSSILRWENPTGRNSNEKHSYGRLLSLSLLDYCAR